MSEIKLEIEDGEGHGVEGSVSITLDGKALTDEESREAAALIFLRRSGLVFGRDGGPGEWWVSTNYQFYLSRRHYSMRLSVALNSALSALEADD